MIYPQLGGVEERLVLPKGVFDLYLLIAKLPVRDDEEIPTFLNRGRRHGCHNLLPESIQHVLVATRCVQLLVDTFKRSKIHFF